MEQICRTHQNKNLVPNENYKSLNFFLDFDKNKFDTYFYDSPIKELDGSVLRNVIIATDNSNSIIFNKIN